MKILKILTNKNNSKCKLVLKIQNKIDLKYFKIILQNEDYIKFTDYREPLNKPQYIEHKINKNYFKILLKIEEIKDIKIFGQIKNTNLKHLYEPKEGDIVEIYKNSYNISYLKSLINILKISNLKPVLLVYLDCDEYVFYNIEPYDYKELLRQSYKNEENYQLETSFKKIITSLKEYTCLKIITGHFLKSFKCLLKNIKIDNVYLYESDFNFELINNHYIYKSKKICKLMGYISALEQNKITSSFINLYFENKLILDLNKINYFLENKLVKNIFVNPLIYDNFWILYTYSLNINFVIEKTNILNFDENGIAIESFFILDVITPDLIFTNTI